MVGEVGLERAVGRQVGDLRLPPADGAGPEVRVCATDREREPADHERVEPRVARAGQVVVRGRALRHEHRVVGREVVEGRGRGVGVRRRVEHILLREAAALHHVRGLDEHPAGDAVEVLRDECDLPLALPEDDHSRPQPRVLADDEPVGAHPAHHVVAGRRGDVGAADADPKLGRGACGRGEHHGCGQGDERERRGSHQPASGGAGPSRRPP